MVEQAACLLARAKATGKAACRYDHKSLIFVVRAWPGVLRYLLSGRFYHLGGSPGEEKVAPVCLSVCLLC
jgi:hypothetical protein